MSGGHLEDMGMGTFCLALLLGIMARAGLSKVISLPYTVILMIFGLIIGVVVRHLQPGIFLQSIDVWTNISPEAVMYTILPILIFESSFSSDLNLFMKQIIPVLTLAVPAVIFQTTIIALFAQYVFPYDWTTTMSFAFGSMLAATDPVAVVALLKDLGVAESLSVLIEGESLMNDGTAIVLFSIFMSPIVSGRSLTGMEVVRHACTLSLGGPLIGYIIGAASSWVLGVIMNDPLSEITVTVIACFGAFTMAESTGIHASGVLAMVFAGLYLSFHGLGRISASVAHSLHSFWQMSGYIANTLIFFVSGLIMAQKALASAHIHPADWGYLILLYVVCSVVRAVAVFLAYPILCRGPYGINWRQAIIMSYGGLRGAIGLTLALAVHQEEVIAVEDRDRILFFMAGIVLLTVIINGTTTKALLQALGLDQESMAETKMFIHTSLCIEHELEDMVRELQKDQYLGGADWPTVWRYLPVPTPQVYWHRIATGHVLLGKEEEDIIMQYMSNPGKARQLYRWAGWWTRYKFTHLPPRLRGRWMRYIHAYNRVKPTWPGFEKVETKRLAIYEALENRVAPAFKEDAKKRQLFMKLSNDNNLGDLPTALHAMEEGLRQPSRLPSQSSFRLASQPTLAKAHSGLDFIVEEEEGPQGCDSLPEARHRVLSVLKRSYWACFQRGLLSPDGLRAFERIMAILVIDTSDELHQWDTLQKYLLSHLRAMTPIHSWRNFKIVGRLVDSYLANKLAFVFEMALVFIRAHRELKTEDLFGNSYISQKLAQELRSELRQAQATLVEFIPAFPDVFASVKTKMACRFLLHRYRGLLEEQSEAGNTTAREHEMCIRKCDNSLVKLFDHRYSQQATPRQSILSTSGFLRFVGHELFDQLFSEKAKRVDLCKDVFLRAHNSLSLDQGKGWYVLVRGSLVVDSAVVMEEEGTRVGTGTAIGLVECLMDRHPDKSYHTASFTHLLYFDKAAVLAEANRCPALSHSLWWYVALMELSKTEDYGAMPIPQLSTLLSQSQYIHIPATSKKGQSSSPQSHQLGYKKMMNGMSRLSWMDSDEIPDHERRRLIRAHGDSNLLILQGGVTSMGAEEKDQGEEPTSTAGGANTLTQRVDARSESSTPLLLDDQQIRSNPEELGDNGAYPMLRRNVKGAYWVLSGSVCFVLPVLRGKTAFEPVLMVQQQQVEREEKDVGGEWVPLLVVEEDEDHDKLPFFAGGQPKDVVIYSI